jgi:hypothetical protein
VEDVGFVDEDWSLWCYAMPCSDVAVRCKPIDTQLRQCIEYSIAGTMVRGLDLSPEQVELSLVEVRRRLSNKKNPVWVSASVCYAQKPALEASTCHERQLLGLRNYHRENIQEGVGTFENPENTDTKLRAAFVKGLLSLTAQLLRRRDWIRNLSLESYRSNRPNLPPLSPKSAHLPQ